MAGNKLIRKKQINLWEIQPSDLSFLIDDGDGIAVGYDGDYKLTPIASTGGTHGQPTGLYPSELPIGTGEFSSSFAILVNGLNVDLANGPDDLYNSHCYFSQDGVTSSLISEITTSSQLYWNPEIAGYDLDPLTDTITFQYEVGNPLYLVGPQGPIGKSSFLLNGTLTGLITTDTYFNYEGVAMDTMPYTFYSDGALRGLSFASQTTDDWTVEIYKNGSLYTPISTSGSSGDSYSVSVNIPFSAGDTLSYRFVKISNDITSPRISGVIEVS